MSRESEMRVWVPEAAVRLEHTYHQIRRLVELGVLQGGRTPGGRWFVAETSLRRFEQERATERAEANA